MNRTRPVVAHGLSVLALALALPFALVACGPPAYLNIPSDEGDLLALSSANLSTARELSTKAIASVAEDSGAPPSYEFVLASNANFKTYRIVARDLGPAAITPTANSPEGLPLFAIRSIRVRGTEAQVEVVRPSGVFGWELVDVNLVWNPFGGWRTDMVRPRRIQVDAPTRPEFDLAPQPAPEPAADGPRHHARRRRSRGTSG
ncbi:MAG: hypothetical protein AAF288_04005 [Planctomycetota bacterium]